MPLLLRLPCSHEDPEQCDGEDDGWLLTYVHDETAAAESGSSVVVWDAATMASEPVAVIALPQVTSAATHSATSQQSQPACLMAPTVSAAAASRRPCRLHAA